MNMEKNVVEYVESTLKQFFGYSGSLTGVLRDTPLTLPPFGLTGSDLYRLLMLVEKEFSIEIRVEDVKKCGFRTINEIVNLVCKVHSFY